MNAKNNTLSKSAEVVHVALMNRGLPFEVIELSESTRTAKEAATTLNCHIAQIVKSILFYSEQTNEPVLVLASGINRINEVKIEEIIAEKIQKADADFTHEVTGFAIGGIPPVGHKQTITHIFIDEDLLKYDMLWAAAGTPQAVFSFHSSHLVNLTGGKIIAIK
jgi:prolyl-tRNA editing enzyme YbaK/EbsC (Cys-tRNA(Pro) deacylase)